MSNYGTEVKLLAITRLSAHSPISSVSDKDGENLIEYASRLCVDKTEGIRSRESYIRDRIEQGHESVIEHASASFYVRCSRAVTHELVRHRIASYSQRSQRYVRESEPRYITPPELEGIVIFEAYPGTHGTQTEGVDFFRRIMNQCWDAYSHLLKVGVKPEIARYVLPNACETQIVVTMNFRELLHFIRLRTSKAALPEMREVAGKIRDICKGIAPEVFADV